MRKFYTLLTMCLLSTLAFHASAWTFNLHVDDPTHVTVVNSSTNETLSLVAGDNAVNLEADYVTFTFTAKPGFLLKSVSREDAPDRYYAYINDYTSGRLNVSTWYEDEGKTYNVVTAPESEVRTKSVSIYVDDASKVTVRRGYSQLELTSEEWNTVLFDPENEATMSIGPAAYGGVLYKVTLDGVDQKASGGTYSVGPLQGGEQIKVQANFPDEKYDVKFTGDVAAISSLKVDGEVVDMPEGGTIQVQAGSKLELSSNKNLWNVTSFIVDGNSASLGYYGTYETFVLAPMTFDITATKYPTKTGKIIIENPECVTLYWGYSYGGTPVALSAGENVIEFTESAALYTIAPASGCYIKSVTDNNDKAYEPNYSRQYEVTMTEGLVVTVDAAQIDRNKTLVVYIDRDPSEMQYFSLQLNDGEYTSIQGLTKGYNEVAFYEGDLPISMSWYDSPAITDYAVYLDGTAIEPMYPGSTSPNYKLEGIDDGSVLKVFLTTATPTLVDVTFEVEGDAQGFGVVRDRVVAVEDLSVGFQAFSGTEIAVTPAEGYIVTVTVGGEAVEAVDGVFTVTVASDPVAIKITAEEEVLDMYVRGDVNNWGVDEAYHFAKQDDGTYTLSLDALAGEFKIAGPESDWSGIDYGAGENQSVDFGAAYVLVAKGQNLKLSAQDAYDITLTIDPATWTLTATGEVNGIRQVLSAEPVDSTVYSIQGYILIKNATAEQIDALPAGLYIIGGQKILKR